jgi:hypothetical protein
MATTRQTMTPVSMNQFSFTGSTPIGAVAPTAGCDYAGTNSAFTAWGSLPTANSNGIQFLNNGTQWLWGYYGASGTTAYVLIGAKSGGIVQVYTQYSVTLAASSYFYLGPFSPAQFNQQDSAQFAGGAGGTAPGGVIGAGAVGFTCIDFLATTALAVRLYQLTPQIP